MSNLADKIFGHLLPFLLGSGQEAETPSRQALHFGLYSREKNRPWASWSGSAGVQSLVRNNSLLRCGPAGAGSQTKTSSPSFTVFHDGTNSNCPQWKPVWWNWWCSVSIVPRLLIPPEVCKDPEAPTDLCDPDQSYFHPRALPRGLGVPFQPVQGHQSCCNDAIGCWSSVLFPGGTPWVSWDTR